MGDAGVAEGVGGAGGAALGAVAGGVAAGPPGAVIGGVIGAIAGFFGGRAAAGPDVPPSQRDQTSDSDALATDVPLGDELDGDPGADDWQAYDSDNPVISYERLIGFTVQDVNDREVGEVAAVWEGEDGTVAYLGVLREEDDDARLVPADLAEVSVQSGRVRLLIEESVLERAPTEDEDQDLDEDLEEAVLDYYDAAGFGYGKHATIQPHAYHQARRRDQTTDPEGIRTLGGEPQVEKPGAPNTPSGERPSAPGPYQTPQHQPDATRAGSGATSQADRLNQDTTEPEDADDAAANRRSWFDPDDDAGRGLRRYGRRAGDREASSAGVNQLGSFGVGIGGLAPGASTGPYIPLRDEFDPNVREDFARNDPFRESSDSDERGERRRREDREESGRRRQDR